MNKKEKYNYIYEGMNNGRYDEVVRDSTTFGEIKRLTVRKVKKACRELDVDFDDFMKYAQERKEKENEK